MMRDFETGMRRVPTKSVPPPPAAEVLAVAGETSVPIHQAFIEEVPDKSAVRSGETGPVDACQYTVNDISYPSNSSPAFWESDEQLLTFPWDNNDPYPVFENKVLEPSLAKTHLTVAEDIGPPPNNTKVVVDSQLKLRCIFVWINNQAGLIKGTIDGGSQIVAMSERKADEMKILYNPTKRLPMVSANRTTEETLGLARNVPIELDGGVTVFLQIYIVRNASYDLLLGRPFKALLLCVATSNMSGQQSLCISCPNTGQQMIIPTYTREEKPGFLCEMEPVFQESRI